MREKRARPSEPFELVRKAIQVHDSYLIAETGDGMVVIDQHALHERILYEELRNRVGRGRSSRRGCWYPSRWICRRTRRAFFEQTELAVQLGLEVEPFGGDTVLVRSMPAMLRQVNPGRLVRDLAEHLRTQPLPPTRDGILAELMHMIACKGAVKAGQPLSASRSRRYSNAGTWWPTRITARTAGRPRWCSPRPTSRSSSGGLDGILRKPGNNLFHGLAALS